LDYRFLCGVLNSRYLRWKYDAVVREQGRVFPQVKWAKICRLPILDVEEKKQQPIIRLVDRILSAKQRNPKADTSALEQQIDQLVYALYGLTPEEIQIVEENTRR
jgi:hypothetical protein